MQRFQRRAQRRLGFTLIELMIAVGIVAVLAAIAIPSFISYIRASKSTEAFSVLLEIRDRQTTMMSTLRRYSDRLPWMPYDAANASAADVCGRTHFWNRTSDNFKENWIHLYPQPREATYYTYETYSDISDGWTPPATFGTTWPRDASGTPLIQPWFVGHATGDLDCDGQRVDFWITSASREPMRQQEGIY